MYMYVDINVGLSDSLRQGKGDSDVGDIVMLTTL